MSKNSTTKIDAEGGQLLMEAVKYGNNELLRELLSSGDSVHYLDYCDERGFTALHFAATLNDATCLNLLLAAGAEVNFTCNSKDRWKTPLHVAAENNNVEICKILVDAGADVFASDKDGYSSLEVSQMHNHQNVAFVLLDAIEQRQQKINDLKSKLNDACVRGDTALAENVFLEAGTKFLPSIIHGHRDEYTPLYKACENGHYELAKLLLKKGADGRIHPLTSYSPLYVAARCGFVNLVELLLEHFPHLAQVATVEKRLPFHAAAESGSVDCAKMLIDYNYPSHMRQIYNDSSNEWEYELPFDVNLQDANCETALFISCASERLKCVEFLLDFSVVARPNGEKIAASSRQTSSNAASVNNSLNETTTTYEDVVHTVSEEEALTLMENEKLSTTTDGFSTLKKARSKLNASKTMTTTLSKNFPTNKTMEKTLKPVSLNVYNARGYTPLHVAVMKSNKKLVEMLVDAGADVNLPLALTEDDLIRLQMEEVQICGSGALIEACRNGDLELVEYLLDKGGVDHENKALAVCVAQEAEILICKLLSRHVFNDPEFRINKKCVELDPAVHLAKGRAVVPSSLFPTCPVMLNWHSASLKRIKSDWLTSAALQLNPKLSSLNSVGTSPTMIFAAITRIDVAKNQLIDLPLCVFQLPSLRILNAAHNKIETLPTPVVETSTKNLPTNATWNVPVLEEIHIEHNKLESLPSILFELPNLQGLDASNNCLVSLPPNVWSATKLKDLNVSFNQLKWLPNVSLDVVGGRRTASISIDSTGAAVDVDADDTVAVAPPLASPSGVSFKSVDGATTATTGTTTTDDSDEHASVDSFHFGVRTDDSLSFQELKRHNLWQKSLELSKLCDDDTTSILPSSTSTTNAKTAAARSCLTSLNLSHNCFERIPEGLPCVAPSLSRLNLSHNKLFEVGPVNAYPPRLKHLDLANNRIKFWFGSPTGGCCPCSSSSSSPQRPVSPVSSRRSHSVVRGNRSLSVAAGRSAEPLSLAQSICVHRRHNRLDNLRTLVLAGNSLESLILNVQILPASSRGSTTSSSGGGSRRPSSGRGSTNEKSSPSTPSITKSDIVFPHLSMLDVSNNHLRSMPSEISEITTLSVLNLSNNAQITYLPADMGLLSRLWNLNLSGCNLGEPLKSMLDSKRYKTMDIIGYLKSILEDSKPYMRLKLMIVGVQGIGKTSILEQLRQEGTGSYKKQPAEGWAKRMGNKNINQKTNRGVNISTVGVDVNDWTYEPRKSKNNQAHYGPVTFRTWDFGGQREYYATHQYFLSKRSLYLVVWRVTDGEAGVSEITQWLVNIQARAPNSPVIIVGTHYDEIVNNLKKFPQGYIEDLQKLIRERFVAVQDADKKGLPRVVDSVIISSKTRFNIRILCDLIYHTACELRSPGTKDRLLEQKVPATYLALEEIVGQLAGERKQQNQDPVLTANQFRSQVQEAMKKQFGKQFRDVAELNQATSFLHENGVLLHYDDATLKDLYFLDPQWLCDILAHVITIREINPFAKNGLMKTDDLKILFKSSKFSPSNIRFYILNLIQKFEVALTWDNRTLLIPSLLPDEYQLRAGYPDCEVKIPLRSKGWIVRAAKKLMNDDGKLAKSSTFVYYTSHDRPSPLFETKTFERPSSPPSTTNETTTIEEDKKQKFVPLFTLNRPKKSAEDLDAEFYVNCSSKDDACLRRLYVMAYVPSGFWSRLITRLLGDEILPNLFDEYFKFSTDFPPSEDVKLRKILEANKAEWLLWQTGVEVKFLNRMLFSLKEFLPLAEIRDYNYKDTKFKCRLDNALVNVDTEHASITEIVVPSLVLSIRFQNAEGKAKLVTMETDLQSMTKLLAMVVETVDTLLEDWYPSLGTRFVHTSEGKYLISRLVPCPYCLIICGRHNVSLQHDDSWTILSLNNSTKTTSKNGPIDKQQNVALQDGRIVKSKTFDASLSERQRRLSSSSQDSGMVESAYDAAEVVCVRSASLYDVDCARAALTKTTLDYAYAFTIEELILAAHESTLPSCPSHGPMTLSSMAPDTVFLDLGEHHLIVPEQVKRSKMLGRGAFGFVFKAAVKFRGQNNSTDVALKMLQPVDPGFGAKQSAISAYKAAWAKWQRDPTQYACRAYCTARQELSVLLNLKHPNVVPLIGVCTRPLALSLGLAPLGSLNSLLQNYRRSGAYLHLTVIQETGGQVAKALEYLHQQRIIYRDLKSDNVLVWQYPPPFSKLTNVEVKLGDYGISRSILPTGGAKGFGGTEGYMAPEIMRYNGEEEYTEKADCFSFAMFLYELLTLKMPFEGQEQIKEYILDGGRPVLTTKELLYPSNIIDLMVVCWSQQPTDRPSSSQLVSISTAPEFAHLLDVVSMNNSDALIVSGEAFTLDDGYVYDESTTQFEGETWLSRADGLVSVLTCNQHGWLDYKNIVINEESFITAVCLVDDTIWLGELTGVVRVFCVKTYSEMCSFPLAPYVLPNEESPKHQCSLQIVEIMYCTPLRSVLVCIGQPGALLLCRTSEVFAGRANVVVAGCKSSQGVIHCCALVPISEQTFSVWCGHTAGYVSIFSVSPDHLHQTNVINHYDPVVEGLEVSRLVTSANSGRYVWSYVYPGCVLYQWDVNERVIISKLDCSKIAPCSESINTINIDERLSPGRCQVTALTLVEKEDGTQLYVGTTWGVVIVTEADQLKPITALRPHVDDVRVIIPISQSKRATVAASPLHRQSTTSVNSRGSESRAPTGKGSQTNIAAANNGGGSQQGARLPSTSTTTTTNNNNISSSYVITIGKGYRSLIQRFLDNYKEDASILESRNKDFFAILWRTDDWFNY